MAPKRARQGTLPLDPVFQLSIDTASVRELRTVVSQLCRSNQAFQKAIRKAIVLTTFVEDDPEPAREEGPARKRMKETDQARFAQCARCEETYDLLSTGDSMTCKRHSGMYLSS